MEVDPITSNRQLRIKYLLKEIEKKKWKSELKRVSKKDEKNNEIRQILDMYITALTDIFSTFCNKTLEGTLEYNCKNLKKYVNTELLKISKKYKNSVVKISDNWC